MKKMIVLMMLTLTSCGVMRENILRKYCQQKDSIAYIEKTIKNDTTILLTDTISVPFYLPNPCQTLCDSLGNLKPIDITHSSGGTKIKIKNNKGKLMIDCDLDKYKTTIKNAITTTIRDNFKQTTLTKTINQLTVWQWFQIYVGRISLCLVLLFIIYIVLKSYFKFL